MSDTTPTQPEQPAADPLTRLERIATPQRRLYLYRVTMALLPLLIAAGVLDEGLAGNIALLVAALLSIGVPALAAANVPRPTIAQD